MTDLNNTLLMDMATLSNHRLFSIEPLPFSLQLGDHGRLYEHEGRLHYAGDYHESATVFIDYLCSAFNLELSRLKRENEELRQINSELATAAIIKDGYALVPVGHIELAARYTEHYMKAHGLVSDMPALLRSHLPE